MNPSILAAVASAQKSLGEPEAQPSIRAIGAFQIVQKGSGDVLEMEVGPRREIKRDKLDGNISADSFDRLW